MKAIFSKGDKPFENRQTYPYEMNINYSIYNLYDVGNINLSFVPSFTALHYIVTCKCHVFSFRKYSLKSLKLLCWTFHYRQKNGTCSHYFYHFCYKISENSNFRKEEVIVTYSLSTNILPGLGQHSVGAGSQLVTVHFLSGSREQWMHCSLWNYVTHT